MDKTTYVKLNDVKAVLGLEDGSPAMLALPTIEIASCEECTLHNLPACPMKYGEKVKFCSECITAG